MPQNYQYFAFISYNQLDVAWGKRLQRKLEYYKMPATLCHEKGWRRTPIRPVFFAPTDIQPNELSEELKARLKASRHLIVICSPHSAQSAWVGKEIAYFHSLGRANNIHFFIIDGVPNSGDPQTECFNPIIKELGMGGRLGANINERNYRWRYLNRQRAYVQLITKLLGIEFDAVWQRHKRQMVLQWTLYTTFAFTLLLTGAWGWNHYRPVTVKVALEEVLPPNNNLPTLSDAEVALVFDKDVRKTRIRSIDEVAQFSNIPKYLLGNEVVLCFSDYPDAPQSANYYPVQKEMPLQKEMRLPICRDTLKYGRLKARVVNGQYKPIPNFTLSVAGLTITTNEKGNFDILIPYERQQQKYVVLNDTLANIGLASRFAIVVD